MRWWDWAREEVQMWENKLVKQMMPWNVPKQDSVFVALIKAGLCEPLLPETSSTSIWQYTCGQLLHQQDLYNTYSSVVVDPVTLVNSFFLGGWLQFMMDGVCYTIRNDKLTCLKAAINGFGVTLIRMELQLIQTLLAYHHILWHYCSDIRLEIKPNVVLPGIWVKVRQWASLS